MTQKRAEETSARLLIGKTREFDLCSNEVRHGRVVSEYVPFVPHESECKDAPEIESYLMRS